MLLKQEVGEAKANVNKRLEFINNELCVSFSLQWSRRGAHEGGGWLMRPRGSCRQKVNAKIDLKEKDAVEIRSSVRRSLAVWGARS